MPKLKAPEGATSCSHDGQSFDVDTDGTVDVPDEAVVALMCHGFAPATVVAPVLTNDEAAEALAKAEAEAAEALAKAEAEAAEALAKAEAEAAEIAKLAVAADLKKGGKK
jgi:hypothetical protein